MTLGERIRQVRNQREMTLEQLARRTELTVSFLSQVERDAVSPSIDSLRKIAQTLGTRVGAFFEEEVDARKELTLIRRAERPRTVDKATRSTVEMLASGLLNIKMEPRVFTLEPGGEIGKGFGIDAPEAFLFILEGEVQFIRDNKGEPLALSRGDSIYLRNPRLYKIVNRGSQKAEVLGVTMGPEV